MSRKIRKEPVIPIFQAVERVGIYCRVSSTAKPQLRSLAAQASYLTKHVLSVPRWQLVDIYLDVGSGASAENRPEFMRLIDDVKNGIIQSVVTKSISRLGRNAEEILTVTRMLKGLGGTVYFEEQGISTKLADSELYISLYAAVAESEFQQISENIKWGIRKRVEEGTSEIYNRPCYGYRLDEDREFVIEPEEAVTVRLIYDWYLSGLSVVKIKAKLEQEGIPSPAGKNVWSKHTIDSILKNKKYCGFSIVYQTFMDGYPTPKRITNIGYHPKYEIAEHHIPIIPLELFERVQQVRADRTNVEVDADGNRRRKKTKYSVLRDAEIPEE